jgi:copper transport protein
MRAASFLFGALLALAAPSCGAWAHAALKSSQPADGAVVRTAPKEIVLRFGEPVEPVRVRLLDLQAAEMPGGGAPRVEGNALILPLPPNLPDGVYVVPYRVTSADSHPVAGSLTFAVGNEPPPGFTPAAPSPLDLEWQLAYAAARYVMVAACLIAGGGVLALWRLGGLAAARPRMRLMLSLAAGLGVLATIASLGLKGGQLLGGPPSTLADPQTWALALQSSQGANVGAALAGLLLILFGVRRRAQGVALAGAALAFISFGLSGHAATATPRYLLAPAVVLHAACAGFWLGALAPLLADLRLSNTAAVPALVRFSRDAVKTVALLLVLGGVLAVFQVTHLPLLWETLYGRLLMGKIALVAVLLVTAGINKWRLTPRLIRGEPDSARALRRAIGFEYLLFAAILAMTVVLSSSPPPRAEVERDNRLALAGKSAFSAVQDVDGYRVTLGISPAEIGHNALVIDVADASGKPFAAKQMRLVFIPPHDGMEPVRRTFEPDVKAGRFVHHGTELSFAGDWKLEVHVLVDDFTDKAVTFAVPMRPSPLP